MCCRCGAVGRGEAGRGDSGRGGINWREVEARGRLLVAQGDGGHGCGANPLPEFWARAPFVRAFCQVWAAILVRDGTIVASSRGYFERVGARWRERWKNSAAVRYCVCVECVSRLVAFVMTVGVT